MGRIIGLGICIASFWLADKFDLPVWVPIMVLVGILIAIKVYRAKSDS